MLTELPRPDFVFTNRLLTSGPGRPCDARRRARPTRLAGPRMLLLLLLLLLGGAATTALAQTNRFVTHDDSNQVPAGTAKSGNVIPNDDNPDNLPNSAFVVTLVSRPGNGTLAFEADGSYVYTPAAGYLGADSFTYQICQAGATPTCSNTSTVALSVYAPADVCTLGTGRNLLQNPSFTDGNVGFTTSYRFVPSPTAVPILAVEGGYAVDADAEAYSLNAFFRGTGRTGVGDKFMIVNGGASLAAVYAQTVTVLPNRYYSFSVYATSINPNSPAQLALVVGGKSTSAVTTLSTNVGQYQQISDLYFSGPGPAGGFPVTIEIRDVNKTANGNDFGIDDLYFGSCTTFLLAETKTTAPVPNAAAPAPILPLSATLDPGGSVGVTVASFTILTLPPTGTLTYNGAPVVAGQMIPVARPGDPTSLSSGGTLTYTPAGSCGVGSTTFTYSATNTDGQGSNNIATYTIPLGAVPPPLVRTPQGANPFCEGESVTLSAGPRPAGYRYTWFNGPAVVNGAGAVLNDSTFKATAPGSYSVRVELAGCGGTSAPVSITTKACAKAEPEPCSFDEKFINTWYFGNKAGLNFNGQAPPAKTPAVLTDGQMVTPAGAATMSDNNGALLFYSNGESVWNRSHAVMPNGTGLLGNPATTDGPVAIRRPGSTTRYYLFTQDARGGDRGLSFSEIDMSLSGGQGDVVAATKNTFLTRRTAEKMTAVLHDNGCDSWIIVHGYGDAAGAGEASGSAFLAYQVTATGVITTPVVSAVGPLHAPSIAPQAFRGQMKVSPDGKQLAVARFNDGPVPANGTIELYDFDAKTGRVSNPRTLDSGEGGYYGVEFSPGRTRLYATVLSPPKLLQFNLSAPPDSIAASKKVIPTPAGGPNLGSIQAAPNGKLYVARDGQPVLGVITYPDSLAKAVAYVATDTAQALGGRLSGLGLPNFNQSFLVKLGFGYQSTACLVIKFQAGTSIPDPETYEWTFGDNLGTSREKEPTFTFPAPGNYPIKLRVTKACLCKEITALITVPGAPTPGSIAADQALCNGATPAPLTSTAPAGAGTGQYRYQWQSSPDNATWADIGGANGPSFAPGPLTATTSFRRLVTSGFCGPRTPTASVTIRVLPPLTAGGIAGDQTVCAGTAPAPLTSTAAATGATGTFAYQWESSLDNVTFTAIGGANGEAFAPGPLAATTYFRRRVSSGACTTAPSNVVTLTVLPGLTAGSIAADQALCAGATPTPLTSTGEATGGTGGIAYQWESSPDNATFTAIAGATGPTFAPGALSATTYFRRRASAGGTCAPVLSNVVTITVTPALTAGTVGSGQSLCTGATPAPLTSLAGPGGGTGSYLFQWESSPDQVTFTAIAGANSETFAPGPIAGTTYFRRRVISGLCGPGYSNTITLAVLPELVAGNIAASQDVCAGATPTPLTSTEDARGGTGTFAYQWESSPDNVTWTAITGATGPTFAPGPLSATTYFRRRVTSGTGTCSTALSGVVAVRVQPIVTTGVSLAAPPVQCPGTPLTFTAVATNAGSAPTFRWLVNNAPVASGPTFSSSTLVTGDQVRVEVTPTAGLCSTGPASASVTVTRTATPTPTLAIEVQPGGPVCAGAPLTFSIARVTDAGPAPQYQWLVNGTDVPGAVGPVFTSTVLREGQTVTLRLRTTTACGQPATVVSNGVVVRISPPVDVDAGPDKEILAGGSVTLEGRADGSYPVSWTPAASLAFPGNDQLHPVASPTVTTTYTLSAGAGGCADADQVTVTVRPPIRIPNAFTPNNDGHDDTWQIEHIEEFPDNTVSVFNRWGNRVFSATNYSRANEWRGDINGQPAPVGTYYYVVVTKGPLGRSYSGPITILY